MKKSQILLGAIVALFAMIFTIAGKANVLGTTLAKADVTDGCYKAAVLTNSAGTIDDQTAPPNSCGGSPRTCANGTITVGATQYVIPSGHSNTLPAIASVDAGDLVSSPDGSGCPPDFNQFCCYKIVSNHVTTIYYRS